MPTVSKSGRTALLKVPAIGWHIDEYGIAQISMNITDIEATPLHIAFMKYAPRLGLEG